MSDREQQSGRGWGGDFDRHRGPIVWIVLLTDIDRVSVLKREGVDDAGHPERAHVLVFNLSRYVRLRARVDRNAVALEIKL